MGVVLLGTNGQSCRIWDEVGLLLYKDETNSSCFLTFFWGGELREASAYPAYPAVAELLTPEVENLRYQLMTCFLSSLRRQQASISCLGSIQRTC